MNFLKSSALAILLGVFTACGDNINAPITELPRELSLAERRLIDADNDFSLRLFRAVHNVSAADSNVFISPLSVSVALGMTMNGAAGETLCTAWYGRQSYAQCADA